MQPFSNSSSSSFEIVIVLAPLRKHGPNQPYTEDLTLSISLAKQAAAAVYHFREPILREVGKEKVGPMKDETAESMRQRLGDAVDSVKHGILRDPDRTTTFRASLAFEYNSSLGFRFMRTEVLATNKRFGTFELSDAILEYVPLFGNEIGLRLHIGQIDLPHHPFLEWAETYVTPKSGFDLMSVGIRTYQRNASGAYNLVDPPEVKFRVVEK